MLLPLWTALFVVALFSATAAFLLFLADDTYEAISPYLLSLSAGTMFGAVFIHLVFRMANNHGYTRLTGAYVILGLLASLLLERLVHWHCHHAESHSEPVPYVLAAGDAFHNVIDGVLITTSYLASPTAGVGATVAVITHKIPKEVGDFGVMVAYGFSKAKAILTNIVLSAFMFLGAGLVLLTTQASAATIPVLLPVIVGNFLFIAGSDLLPSFKDDEHWHAHFLVFTVGVIFMYAIPYVKASLI